MKEKNEKPENDFNLDSWCDDNHSKEDFENINQSKFCSIIDKNLKHEGGYANNKNDRGGETNFGITKRFMEEYKNALPQGKAIPIKELTTDDAKRLYKALWDRYKLGHIKDKNLAYVIFDYMINSHAHTVAKRIQGILNKRGASLKIDGHIGKKSLEAIHNSNKEWLIDEILKNRQHHHRIDVEKNPKQAVFYAGWMNRLNKIAETVGSSLHFSPKLN